MKFIARYFTLLEFIYKAKVYFGPLKVLLLLETYFVEVGVVQSLPRTYSRLRIELEHAFEELEAAPVHGRVHLT